jgi:Protein of unknown function DUF262
MVQLISKPADPVIFEEESEQYSQSEGESSSELDEIAGIVVTGTDWTTATIFDQLVKGNIQLSPKFQRRDAWDVGRKSRFIESIMLGFPIPHIVLAAHGKERGKFVVLDGKQRLLTILQFYGSSETQRNKFKLKELEFRPELNGFNYDDLRSNPSYSDFLNAFDNQTIRTTLIRNWQTESFLHKIFLRLNVENTPLSTQELRQALHPGGFVDFLDDRSMTSESLRKIFKSKDPDFRMRDVELLLRYISFRFRLNQYKGDLKDFLDTTCEVFNAKWSEDSESIIDELQQFEEAVKTTSNIFGDNFFRVWLTEDRAYRNRFNRAVLDVMVFYFSDVKIRESAKGKNISVEDAFKKLCSSSPEFKESIEKNTKSIKETHNRLFLWGEALSTVLDLEFNLPQVKDNTIIFDGLWN